MTELRNAGGGCRLLERLLPEVGIIRLRGKGMLSGTRELSARPRVNRLWLALSFVIGVAFVPLDSKVQVVLAATEMRLAGAFASPFVTLFLPTLAIAAVSGERPLTILISTLIGVVSGVVSFALIFGFPQVGVVVLAMFMACLLSAPAIIAGASLGSWLKTSSSPANLFDRTSLMKILAFAIGVLFVEMAYHLPPVPFGMLSELALATLVLFPFSMALTAYSDRKPWSTVLLMLGGVMFGVIVDVSLDTKVDRNLWPIEIVIVCAMAAPGVILGTAAGTRFGIRLQKSSQSEIS